MNKLSDNGDKDFFVIKVKLINRSLSHAGVLFSFLQGILRAG